MKRIQFLLLLLLFFLFGVCTGLILERKIYNNFGYVFSNEYIIQQDLYEGDQ